MFNWMWQHKKIVAVVVLLFISHGVTAVSVHKWWTAAAQLVEADRQRKVAEIKLKVLETDLKAAEKMRAELEEYADRVKELEHDLENADSICFDDRDAGRVRKLFD